MGDVFSSRMFLLAGLWNVVAALGGLVFYEFQFRLLFGPGAPAGGFHQALYYRFSMTAVLIFGIGYWMVAMKTGANRGIVWLGALGKSLLFFTFTWLFAMGKVTAIGFSVALGDFIWALLFLAFLLQTRGRVRQGFFLG